MKSELTFTHDPDELPPDGAFADQWNTITVVTFRFDLWTMKHSKLTPDEFLDEFVGKTKDQLLEHYHNRYPEERP